MVKKIIIKKASGELEPFDPEKIKNACIRAGASEELTKTIIEKLEKKLRPKMTTREIFWIVFRLLEKEKSPVASKFNLKRAIMNLGPSGFTFETFFSEVMEEYGYSVELRQKFSGKCIEHEIDIVAKKDKERSMVECKYHNISGIKCDVRTALYTWARFLDLKDGHANGMCPKFDRAWLVTNTKFTSEAIQYSECQRINLVGWNYPQIGNLRDMIEQKKLYPVTILRTIDNYALKKLSKANLVLVKGLIKYSSHELGEIAEISGRKAETILQEALSVFGNNQ